MTSRSSWTKALSAAAALAALAPAARAVEGVVQYPHGAEGLGAGALPPPGTYFLAYGLHYGGTLKDTTGNNVVTPGGNVQLGVNALALRLVHMTDFTILGAQYGVHAIVPIMNNAVTVGAGSSSKTGIGDMVVCPLILAWHHEKIHWAFAFDTYIPTGSYSTTPGSVNTGANYWSFEPLVAATYLPGLGFELDAKLMYNIKTKNTATDYRSGDELHMDFTVAKSLTDSFRIGLGGYWDYQIQGDQQANVDVGNKARYFALGPELAYQLGKAFLIAKYQTEIYARNSFEGSRVILKLVTGL